MKDLLIIYFVLPHIATLYFIQHLVILLLNNNARKNIISLNVCYYTITHSTIYMYNNGDMQGAKIRKHRF